MLNPNWQRDCRRGKGGLAKIDADGKNAQGEALWEALANGNDGVPLGREVEMARLLSSSMAVPNGVWITTEGHYCAAHW